MPKDWRKGLLVKIPRERVTVKIREGLHCLQFVSKVMEKIILSRIKQASKKQPREEQAGF